MNFSLQSFNFIEMKTSPTPRAPGTMIGVNVWKDLRTACSIISPFPPEFPALETKHITWIEQPSHAGRALRGECPVGLSLAWEKKKLLVEKYVSFLNWNLIPDSQTYSWKVIRTLFAFFALILIFQMFCFLVLIFGLICCSKATLQKYTFMVFPPFFQLVSSSLIY